MLRAPPVLGDPLRAPTDAREDLDPVSTTATATLRDREHRHESRRGSPWSPVLLRAPPVLGDPLRAPTGAGEDLDPVSTVSTAPTATPRDREHRHESRRGSPGPPVLGDPLRAPTGAWEDLDPVSTAPTATPRDREHRREDGRGPPGPPDGQLRGLEKLLILLRGLPGSGKTTLSRALLGGSPDGVVCSADDYFRGGGGGYSYSVSGLGRAHDWSQSRAKRAIAEGRSPVIIDNTNTQAWEMRPYVEMAIGKGYRVEFHEPETWWKFDPEELEKRNQHGVSRKKIAQMLDRYEFQVSISVVMSSVQPPPRGARGPLPARPGPRWGPPRPRPGDPPGDGPG